MLTLYSFGPGANSLKPMLALYEKGLPFTPRFLNPAVFEHHEDWFKKINPRGQVPALDPRRQDHHESTVICEYLEDVFPNDRPLRPKDPYIVAQMRVWTKWVDEYFCWCVSTIGWERMVSGMARAPLRRGIRGEGRAHSRSPNSRPNGATPAPASPRKCWRRRCARSASRSRGWKNALSESPWLAGPDYTLADICNFAIANAWSAASPDIVNPKATPHLMDWLARINARPAVKEMFAKAQRETLAPPPKAATA
ncbi:MAG: glutathione S-transferase family protein [Rhizomicrobium sp.]